MDKGGVAIKLRCINHNFEPFLSIAALAPVLLPLRTVN